ncbi:MAG: hypothetical protein V4629_04695 [Pseudomonadota bacterium]
MLSTSTPLLHSAEAPFDVANSWFDSTQAALYYRYEQNFLERLRHPFGSNLIKHLHEHHEHSIWRDESENSMRAFLHRYVREVIDHALFWGSLEKQNILPELSHWSLFKAIPDILPLALNGTLIESLPLLYGLGRIHEEIMEWIALRTQLPIQDAMIRWQNDNLALDDLTDGQLSAQIEPLFERIHRPSVVTELSESNKQHIASCLCAFLDSQPLYEQDSNIPKNTFISLNA